MTNCVLVLLLIKFNNMKKLLILLPIAFASCSRCYQCTTYMTISGRTSVNNSQFCGTASEKEEYERAGTRTIISKSGNVTVRTEMRTNCYR